MKVPQKHAHLIKAWADGAEIEYFSNATCDWRLTTIPNWAENVEFRIKPEPKPDVVRYGCYDTTTLGHSISVRLYSIQQDLTDLRTGQIKLIIDGNTGAIKSAEVL